MRLWILRPIPDARGVDETGAWSPWHDKAFGFVVRASDELSARRLASDGAGDEKRDSKHGNPWLDPCQSTCMELLADGEHGVVLSDFRSA